MRDHGNDVTVNVTEAMVVPAAKPFVEEIADFMPQILTQMIQDSGVAQPQIADCLVLAPERWCRRSCARDDHEEEILQTYAETGKKVTIGTRV